MVRSRDPPGHDVRVLLSAGEWAKEQARVAPSTTGDQIEAMRETLRSGGISVVSAPQLFPTPADLAARMVELADIEPDGVLGGGIGVTGGGVRFRDRGQPAG